MAGRGGSVVLMYRIARAYAPPPPRQSQQIRNHHSFGGSKTKSN